MKLSDVAKKIMEVDDDKYVSIGYGRYKLKGKEDDDNADVFTKTDSGQYVNLLTKKVMMIKVEKKNQKVKV